MEAVEKWTSWAQTDDDCCQHMRHCGEQYQMMLSVEVGDVYYVMYAECDMSDTETAVEAKGSAVQYGYTVSQLIDDYGERANDIIAECYLETVMLQEGDVIGKFETEEAAEKFIKDKLKTY